MVSDVNHIKVADEVWVAVALLQRRSPEREGFSPGEIIEQVQRENASGSLRPGVQTHIGAHAVANARKNGGNYRLLYRLPSGRLRLFKIGDDYHPERVQGKTVPKREDLPVKYHYLLDWYAREFNGGGSNPDETDPVLAMAGVGAEIWRDVDPDEYVRALRAGWESET